MSKIRYLRVIVNNECNLSCFFCHKEGSNVKPKDQQMIDNDSLTNMIEMLIGCGINKVKFLGGEPTLKEDLPSIIKRLVEKNPNMDFSMITNGVVEKETLQKYVEAGLNRINVSLHGIDRNVFSSVTGGDSKQLEQIIASINFLKETGILGKINYVVLKGVNESEFMKVLEYTHKNNLILDVLNYIGTNGLMIDRFYYSFDEIMNIIERKYEIERTEPYMNISSLPSTRLFLNGGGIINLKTAKLNESNFLKSCQIVMLNGFALKEFPQ